MTHAKRAKRPGRLQRLLLEIIVPCAMALTATAFAAGLYLQGGFGPVASLVAGVVLFLVMICAQAAYVSTYRAVYAEERLNALETALQAAGGAETPNFSQLAELAELTQKAEQIDQLSDRMQRFDAVAERIEHLSHDIARARPEHGDMDPSRLQRLAAAVDRLDARQEALRTQLQIEARERYEDLSAELQMLEMLVKQVAENVATGQRAALETRQAQELPAPEPDRAEAPVQAPPEPPPEPRHEPEPEAADQDRAGAAEPQAREERLAPLEPAIDELPLIDEVRQSIERNRIELYLQPIMMLPQRRVRYYEAFTRLRNESGKLLMPNDYLALAEAAGVMSVIDNVMLYRSVQVLRRLEQRANTRGVFCNISAHSLLDPEFFPEFISFMEQNQSLAENMFFEFSQPMIENAGAVEQESLAALAALGFRFSLDQVSDLDLDFQAMHARGFRYIKVDANILLHGMSEARAQIHAADMRSYLERYGIRMIVSKIETEADLSSLLDYNIRLGQGFVFSEPRPVRPEIFVSADKEAAA